ncbi:uncharacterized protein MONBRDRAFT_29797 [Monosiga brevicollis MX1]|uniref:Serine-threonine kinase receptor-associated protein n=1 Tax=Monosiga brevicollis TaxID=81824 RepID=A9VC54_MONBE|nr:uncharacterized protein MONBRDRAFT_29797 [Monosiga brevicollis MX1]EDQ84962.1 predicted protein [Monosiga brevicollis MX1]|eukprot:XP_001750303.1 hypothetical protein [Monosiga brevicollis MX1]
MAANKTLRAVPLTCSGHTRPVMEIAFSDMTDEGYFLASACKDFKPMLRRGETGDWVGTFEGHSGAVWGVAINHDASLVATAAADFTAKVFDAVTGAMLLELSHPHIVKSVAFNHDSTLLATGCNDGHIRIMTLARSNTSLAAINEESFKLHKSLIRKVLFVGENSEYIVERPSPSPCRGDDLLLDFPALFARLILPASAKLMPLHTPALSAALVPALDRLVWVGEANLVVECTADGTVQHQHKAHFGTIHCVRFSPDHQLFATCAEDSTIRLWPTFVGNNYGLWQYQQ